MVVASLMPVREMLSVLQRGFFLLANFSSYNLLTDLPYL